MEIPIPDSARIILLYGDDVLGMEQRVDKLCAPLANSGMADLNLARLDSDKATLDAFHAAAYALPFLAERRMVIVHNPFKKMVSTDAARERFNAMLAGLPDSTVVVLVVEDEYLGSKKNWQVINQTKGGKVLLDWIKADKQRRVEETYRLPGSGEMPGWILSYARQQGGEFNPKAAAALAQLTGNDTGLAGQEVVKLLTYVDFRRPVDVADVDEAAASGGQANVFAMVDAVALGNSKDALRLLNLLLEEQDPYSLFGMVVRQFRLLILARAALDEGPVNREKLAKRVHIQEYVAGKALEQAQRYRLTKLETIYRKLLETDKMVKTGQCDPQVALQTLIASLPRESA